MNSAIGGLYFGCSSKKFTLDIEVIGGENFYDAKRNIQFIGFSEQARNNHNGYFFAPRVGVATDFYPKEEGIIRLFGAVVDHRWLGDYHTRRSYDRGIRRSRHRDGFHRIHGGQLASFTHVPGWTGTDGFDCHAARIVAITK